MLVIVIIVSDCYRNFIRKLITQDFQFLTLESCLKYHVNEEDSGGA